MTPKQQLDKLVVYLLAPKEESNFQLDYDELVSILRDVKQALEELERLKKFKETFDNYELAKKQDFIAYENWLECERELEALKKPPTVDEVCKALNEQLKQKVSFGAQQFYYTIENTECVMFVTETYGDGLWSINEYLPPHLITLIGRFYEGLEVKE